MRTHVKGVLIINPNWHAELVGYEVESEWIIGNWDEVQSLVKKADNPSPPLIIAQVLLAMRSGQEDTITEALMEARRSLGGPVTAAGPKGYRRCYESVVNLHLVHEVEMIHRLTQPQMTGQQLDSLLRRLSSRLDFTLPAYRIREPILSLRRTVFGQRYVLLNAQSRVSILTWKIGLRTSRATER